MKPARVLIELFIICLSFNIIYGYNGGAEFERIENIEDEKIIENFATSEGDIDRVWGAINSDSVRIGAQMVFTKNVSIGTIAEEEVMYQAARKIDGIRLRSLNNTGAAAEIVYGGVGFKFAVFQLVARANYLYFVIDAYENYTSSLITSTPTPPVPDRIIKEWGVINYASKKILPHNGFVVWSNPGVISQSIERINSSKIIDGIRLTSINNTVATGEILEGGVGFDFLKTKVVANANFLDFSVDLFENGTYLQEREHVMGVIDGDTKLLDEKRFQKTPESGSNAEGNGTLSTSGTIYGIKLTYLNYTDGQWEITGGGLNQSFVTFDFKGPNVGGPYDFKIEIFGNNAASVKLSIVLVILLGALYNAFR